ncbi:hypothetical protein C1645_739334 [Glomus cerebriforme]|uniref:Uncharacterized protein n=1 Tax=Glomus cerebriforme TaxID=658196 RepID=A0A397T061_9GLOM|nr:hypothetical protein C1645_739334 [Glomus cerebriforme]
MESNIEIKKKMEILIKNITRKAREKIWNKRCEQIIELENKRRLMRSEKRKSSKAQVLTEEERNKITVEKYKKQVIIQQLVNRWMELVELTTKAVTDNRSTLNFYIEENLDSREPKEFWVEAEHDINNRYLTNKTNSIDQNVCTTIAILVGVIN